MSRTRHGSAPTLRDVAERAGVHFSTVSRALNPETQNFVSPKLVSRIVKAARDLRYQPNVAAVHLKTKRSFQIIILVPDLADPVYPPIVAGIRERLSNSRYVAVVGDALRIIGQERHSLNAMKLRPVGGLVLATASLQDRFTAEAAHDGVPFVQILRVTRRILSSTVTVDYTAAMTESVRLLRSLGHRRIGLVAGPETLSTGAAERAAFIDALQAHGLDPLAAPVTFADQYSIEAGRQGFERLRRTARTLTAVLAGSDPLAIGCIDAARAAGLVCPRDLSVVGFNDFPFGDRIVPPLTTVRVDHERAGRLAGDLIVRAIEEPNAPHVHLTVPGTVVLRGSVAEAAARRSPARRHG